MEILEQLSKGKKARICTISGSAHFKSRAVSVGLIPGNTVETLSITELSEGGGSLE